MSTRNPAQGIEIVEESLASLAQYADVRIAFDVTRVLDISHDGEFVLTERVLESPYVKDYDLIERERPARWTPMFDVSNRWDIRVSPEIRGHGVGSALFRAAEAAGSSRSKPRTSMFRPADFTRDRAAHSFRSTRLPIPNCPTRFR